MLTKEDLDMICANCDKRKGFHTANEDWCPDRFGIQYFKPKETLVKATFWIVYVPGMSITESKRYSTYECAAQAARLLVERGYTVYILRATDRMTLQNVPATTKIANTVLG